MTETYYLCINLDIICKLFTLELTKSGIPLTYKINNKGPSTEPCGTPLSTGYHLDISPFTSTLIMSAGEKTTDPI